MNQDFAYFAGCSAKGSCNELDTSTQAVATHFGVTLHKLENPGCTGARQFRAISEHLHLVANGRILALAEAEGHDLAVVCDSCLLNLTEANQRLQSDAEALARVNQSLAETGLYYSGATTVKHFLWILLEDIGEQRIQGAVTRPLSDLKIGPFYGCHIRRPATAHDPVAADRMTSLERLCRLVGAEPVTYDGADKCCGFHVLATDQNIAFDMSAGHLAAAEGQAADCLVTPCPLCHTVLDAHQPDMARRTGRPSQLPILHVAQLVGLAVGLPAEALALSNHVVNTSKITAG